MRIERLGPTNKDALLAMLRALQSSGAEAFFHPHPFTDELVSTLASAPGKDLYWVLTDKGEVIAYGMLRGFNEGYAVPSLGIAVHPGREGSGLGHLMMSFLHEAARLSGAPKIRLRVSRDNTRAIALYTRLGYRLEPYENANTGAEPELIGFFELEI
jgi:ribosomal protein S18 acetylase RimI-like enzyme